MEPGDLSRMFKRIIAEDETHSKVTVLSEPPSGPWVVVIDNFLDADEVDALLTKGGHHFERSLAGDGVTSIRTSQVRLHSDFIGMCRL